MLRSLVGHSCDFQWAHYVIAIIHAVLSQRHLMSEKFLHARPRKFLKSSLKHSPTHDVLTSLIGARV